jgi:hypothetical protein
MVFIGVRLSSHPLILFSFFKNISACFCVHKNLVKENIPFIGISLSIKNLFPRKEIGRTAKKGDLKTIENFLKLTKS